MRVLMFGWEWPPHNSGGLGTACAGLAEALAQAGAEVVFVLPKFLNLAPVKNVRFVFANVKTSLTAYNSGAVSQAEAQYAGDLLSEVYEYARQAALIARREQFDLIHAHDWLTIPAGLAAKAVSGKRLVVHVHATEFDRTGGLSLNERVYEVEKQGFAAADQLVAVSQFTKNIVVEKYAVASAKIAVVHNGVGESVAPSESLTLAKQAKATGRKIVLFVGRVTLQKGPDYFVQAAARVLEAEPKTLFIMAGDGDMLPATIRAVVGRGLSANFLFPGFLRGSELEQIYRAADLFIMPSVSEPFGITPLEALQAGTPVIVSKQSGVAETLAHALKVDFWDTEELANKIIAALRYPSLHKQLAIYGQQEAKNLTWAKAASKLLPIYQKMVG